MRDCSAQKDIYKYMANNNNRHLATRGNHKILCTPPPHTSSSEERLPRLTHRTLAQFRIKKSPFLKSYLHKVDAKTHPSSLQLHPHTHHIVTPGFVDRPRRSDCTAGQMDGEAGWWTTSRNIGLPPLARVMGVGRQQQHSWPMDQKRMIVLPLETRVKRVGRQQQVERSLSEKSLMNKICYLMIP